VQLVRCGKSMFSLGAGLSGLCHSRLAGISGMCRADLFSLFKWGHTDCSRVDETDMKRLLIA